MCITAVHLFSMVTLVWLHKCLYLCKELDPRSSRNLIDCVVDSFEMNSFFNSWVCFVDFGEGVPVMIALYKVTKKVFERR